MKNGKQILSSILKSTQMGQTEIHSVLSRSMRPSLRKALENRLREYDAIEIEAHSLAAQRGWELRDLDPALGLMLDMTTRMKLHRANTDSKIAAVMIRGSTRSMIQGLKNIHQYTDPDSRIRILSQKLTDCETAGIRQMQSFL